MPTQPDPPAPRLYRPGDPVRMARGVRKGLRLVVVDATPADEPALIQVRRAEAEPDERAIWVMTQMIEPETTPKPGDTVGHRKLGGRLKLLRTRDRRGRQWAQVEFDTTSGIVAVGWLPIDDLVVLERAS